MNEYQPLLCQVYLCNLNISEKTDRKIELSEKTLKYQHCSIYILRVDSTIHTLTITCFVIVHNLKYYYIFRKILSAPTDTYIYMYIYIYTYSYIMYIFIYIYISKYVYVYFYSKTPQKNGQVCQRAMTRGGPGVSPGPK